MKYFYSSFAISLVGIGAVWYFAGIAGAYICALLAILEISLSFDNAVVNAKVLGGMDEVWRRRFIVWGIPIAVFGMRFAFPIIIVSVAAGISLPQTLNLAINDIAAYHEHLEAHKMEIYTFGGAFLLMVALEFFFAGRSVRWIPLIESNKVMLALSRAKNASVFVAILLGVFIVYFVGQISCAISYFAAILAHMSLGILSEWLGGDESSANESAARTGLAGFLYLETLDASFSFDGVIGAFAMSNNVFIIMIGLGIGAFFVRALTLYMVEKGTLSEFRFLEHGAHYAILALAIIMFINLFSEVGEIITGTLSFALIVLAFLHSVLLNKKEKNV